MSAMKTQKILLYILSICLFVVLLAIAAQTVNRNERNRLYEQYCSLPARTDLTTSSVHDCIELLIVCERYRIDQLSRISDDYPPYRSKTEDMHDVLEAELERVYSEYMLEIIRSCTVPFEYPADAILTTFNEHSVWLDNISEYYHENEYQYAFDSYIQIHDVHTEDCAYYLVKAAYPEVFSVGIRDRLLDVGVSAWSSAGENMLEYVLRYIDSMPGGRGSYEADIEIAKKQLETRTAQHDASSRINKYTTTNLPYYGMDESQINSTGLGSFDESELCRDYYALDYDHRSITYYWYDNSGDVIFKARSLAGIIITTVDYRSGTPIFDSPSDHQ